jgi:integrase
MGDNRLEWTLGDAKLLEDGVPQKILARLKQAAEFCPMAARDYDFCFAAFNSGFRISELIHIEKGDVQGKRLMMARRKKRKLQPKPVEVSSAVMDLLRKRAAAVEDGYIFPGRAKPCIVHRSRTDKNTKARTQWDEQVCVGGHASIRSIQRRWRLLLEELGIYMYGRGVHSMRHTAATEMYRNTGGNLRKTQIFLGHESSKTTEVYAHVVDMQDTLDKLPVISGE